MQEEARLLPEQRTDLLEGWVTNLEGQPSTDVLIGLSIPSDPYQLRISQTTERGSIIVDYNPKINMNRGVFDVFENVDKAPSTPGEQVNLMPTNAEVSTMDIDGRYRLQLLSEYYESLSLHSTSTSYGLDSLRVQSIVERSIFNQVENAYFVEVPPTISSDFPQIYGFKSYMLDDYTRFPTVRDTFIEYVPWVGVSKNEENFKINLRADIDWQMRDLGNETILLIDGVLVGAEEMFSISPYLVKRIDVLAQKYFFEDMIFDGIIAFHTFSGDAWDTPSKNRQVILTPVQRRPMFEESPAPANPRHADYRTLLSWQPELRVPESGRLPVSFQASDIPGTYAIEINGLTPDGKPISIMETFEVVKAREN